MATILTGALGAIGAAYLVDHVESAWPLATARQIPIAVPQVEPPVAAFAPAAIEEPTAAEPQQTIERAAEPAQTEQPSPVVDTSAAPAQLEKARSKRQASKRAKRVKRPVAKRAKPTRVEIPVSKPASPPRAAPAKAADQRSDSEDPL